ncbi:acyl-CoA N-acetyltransferase [Agaricus bisporus var. bisporus H97]|uniref:acyl-CoA N-acetyltransferase n=1 Tax=Agaricus bisporus var. bisporus (strain H97 / ATCC MYA-4626 / FGSC 10389) TaxID=936046 RepID=UPI00029F5F14|nr:acyl-CoA N-acetyltransferase [Agaricus bisporus var. bisporus H97]EKV52029.1 acyl-CoA N-acetyltransferase [Agaricus bisporus var. bisporus H97]
MSRKSGRVRRAVNATSSDILACLERNDTMPFIRIAHNSELEAKEKADMWDLYEENMFDLYSNSSFGWKPAKRKKEIFHTLSRFLLIYDSQEETSKMIGFCMFRFENEEGGCVVYWFVFSREKHWAEIADSASYDIQLSAQHQRRGLGKMVMEFVFGICKFFDMDKTVLTVLKEGYDILPDLRVIGPSHRSKVFPNGLKNSFKPDPASPSVYLAEDDPSREEYDYEIMSKAV